MKYYNLARIMGQKPLLGDMTSSTKETRPKKHRGILTTSTVFLFEAFWSINGNNGLQLVKTNALTSLRNFDRLNWSAHANRRAYQMVQYL